eukprot:gene4157-7467_t
MGNNFVSDTETQIKPEERKKKSIQQQFILLGTGESGKSTLLKQIKLLFNEKLITTKNEEDLYVQVILGSLLIAMKSIDEYYTENNIQYSNPKNKETIENIINFSKENNLHFSLKGQVPFAHFHKEIIEFFKDESIESYFNEISLKKHIFDGAKYFINERLEQLDPKTYVPTDQDILKCRRKTTGFSKFNFTTKRSQQTYEFSFVDVGGQKNERKKWIQSFDGIDGVIFISSLSEYNQKCYEDDVTNRMIDSLDLFDEHINGTHFRDKPVILILNKFDLFTKKIDIVKLSNTFEEYDGETKEDAIDFIKNQYLKRNKYDPNRIHVFLSEATSISNVEKTLNDILELVEEGKLTSN